MQSNNLQPLSRGLAEELAVQVLGWIATDQDLTATFLGSSGAEAGDLRERIADPDFLGFVLDFLLADEAALLSFCESHNVSPDRPLRARAALPGGDLPHWT